MAPPGRGRAVDEPSTIFGDQSVAIPQVRPNTDARPHGLADGHRSQFGGTPQSRSAP